MKRLILLLIAIFLVHSLLQAQALFYNTIKVEFEKTVYVQQMYKELLPEYFDRNKANLPITALSYFEFIGDTTKSIFKPGREVPVSPRSWYSPIADKNIVYTDYKSDRVVAQKPMYEETFLVEDSLAKIKWKITADLREIAGFECRKAVGILNDSIGVFAFYTDNILIPGGPESIHGLPGMILGMGIPRLHTTWFATKVEVSGVNMNIVLPATKGKKVTYKTMMEAINKVANRWGDYGKKMLLNIAI
ncbi:GLPGLI family protein [Chitinophagaceae bacterium LB-8]|uniref:GLPGLI family protein n=1 Tax=Paraflavisolibacter caeni TaxID=2982496 RepID=A0A9X2Y062_9BACT|nr:GLPGLI family protein [Paraflavisolibacter caeni]MCU7552904.1 GLPGLI family protein [Paraflavisolibacter caeni]